MIKKRTFGEIDGYISVQESGPESKRQKTVEYPDTENEEWISHDFE